MEPALLESKTAAVEIASEVTPARQRLRVRDLWSNVDVYLDPLELEGLTKAREIRSQALPTGPAPTSSRVGGAVAELEVLQNEFAMVEVGAVRSGDGACLFIRDLISRAHVCLDADALRRLTHLSHGELAPLLDPSQLVQWEEPDPDQLAQGPASARVFE